MKRVDFNKMKNDRTKLYQEITSYMESHMYNDFFNKEGNIPQVLQWGNIAKLIFIYYSNPQVHTPEMDKKIEQLKTLSFNIEKEKGFITTKDKININLEFTKFIIDSYLLAKSIESNKLYISSKDLIDMLLKCKDNPRVKRVIAKKKKQDIAIEDIITEYIRDTSFCDKKETVDEHNRIEILHDMNSTKGVVNTISNYRHMIVNEANQEITRFIIEHMKVR